MRICGIGRMLDVGKNIMIIIMIFKKQYEYNNVEYCSSLV